MEILRDLRYAARLLARTRAFTAVAVLTLALGIAGNTTFFAAVDAMVLRPLRVLHADGAFNLTFIEKKTGMSGPLRSVLFRRLEADLPAATARIGGVNLRRLPIVAAIPSRAERVHAEVVSWSYHHVLNLAPQAGRLFRPDDDGAGAESTAIISDRLWREWFDDDRGAIGTKTIRLNGVATTVVGVAPRGFRGLPYLDGGADLWITEALARRVIAPADVNVMWNYWTTIVRPAAGVSSTQAASAIHAMVTAQPGDPAAAFSFVRLSPAGAYFGQSRLHDVALAVVALGGLLLVAACANVANMLFARGAQRTGEVAVRLSLGASRARVFRLFLIESALIGTLASILGLALAVAATTAIQAAFPGFGTAESRVFIELSPDYRVFLFALGCGVVATLAVGLTTAWRASRIVPGRALAGSGVAVGSTRRGHRLRVGMVTVQVIAAVLLLMGAGLYFRATEAALDRSLVFDTAPLATARVDLRLHGYHEAGGRTFYERVLMDLRALPGVMNAAIADGFPAGSYASTRTVLIVSNKEAPGEDGRIRTLDGETRILNAGVAGVSQGFMSTIGMPLLRGRDFVAGDADTTPLVVIVSENVARLQWPGQDPIGKQLMFGNDGHWRTVVGVCGDPVAARVESQLVSPANLVLMPTAQSYRPDMLLVVRTENPAAQLEPIRAAIRAIDENVAPFDVATADRSIMSWVAPLHAATTLMAGLGALALLIATLGIYGVIAYIVSLRSREFGIRMALGARRGQVVKLVTDEALRLLLIGLMAGAFVTSIAERYLQSQRVLFLPNEISTWAVVLVLILAVGLLAAYVPARRASRIDPNVALREL